MRIRTGVRKWTQAGTNYPARRCLGWLKAIRHEGKEPEGGTLVPLSLPLGKINVLINEIEGKYKARGA
jgi:hypothetical protein